MNKFKKYLTNIHQSSDRHKKQFAFLVSGIITLFIFGIWSFTTFGIRSADSTLATSQSVNTVAQASVSEVSPLGSLKGLITTSFGAIADGLSNLKSSFNSDNLQDQYEDLRDNSLDIWSR